MKLSRVITLIFILASLIGIVVGQSSTVLNGRITDSNGDGVPGASVTVERIELRFRRELTADASGNFSLKDVPAGNYVINAVAKGFGSRLISVEFPATSTVLIAIHPDAVAAEISITSSYLAGTSESLAEVPGSIERLDRITLENSRSFNFSEALRKIPGVNVRDEEGFGLRPNIGIRGTNPTRSTKVLLLEDGLPLAYAPYGDNASYYHPPIERYESVEVLKGSSQIAYGPQTIAGVINYLTPNPTEKPSFAVKLAGGNRSFFNGSFTGSGTIKRTGIFANYTRKQGDGARENVDSKLNDISTKIVQTLNDRNALTFKASYYKEDSNVTYSGLTEAEYAANPRANPFQNDNFNGDRFGFSAAHSSVLSPNLTLTTNFYANYFKRHWWRQSSNSGQRPNRLNVDPDCLSLADLNTTCGNEGRLREYQTYGVAPKVDYSYSIGRHFRGELQAGFRLHWEDQFRRQLNGDLPNSRDGVASEINRRRNFAGSGFVQNRFIFGDFAVTPGLRFERITIFRRNLLSNIVAEGQTTLNEVIPGIGFAYSGIPRATIFGGVHRGFSPPRAEDIISNNGGVIELDPERSWNYEFGVRTNPARGVRFEGAFFRLDYENQIVPASLAGGVGSVFTNGGATLQQGFEFSGQVDSSAVFNSRHNVYLRTAFTWLPAADFKGVRRSSITSTPTLNLFCPEDRRISSTQCDVSGNRLPYAPETLLTTSLGYSHSIGFDAFIENVFIGRQFGDDLNATGTVASGQLGTIKSQTYWNATVNYRVEKMRTTFFVTAKNLFDETYIIDRVRGILPSSPRLIQAGAKVNF